MYTPKQPDEQVNIPKQSLLIQALKLFSAVAISAFVLYIALMTIMQFVVQNLTPEQEQKLLAMSPSIYSEIDPDPYLQSIVNKFSQCNDIPYKVKIGYITLGEINAVALPGGTIGITKEMYQAVKNENELAFIIGHELGHFKNRDHLQGFGSGLILGFISLMIGENYGSLFNYSLHFSQARFSQNIEKEADIFGLEMMQCAYGNVNHATTLFKRMNDGDHWSYFLASHPHFDERIALMENYIVEKEFKVDGKTVLLPAKTNRNNK